MVLDIEGCASPAVAELACLFDINLVQGMRLSIASVLRVDWLAAGRLAGWHVCWMAKWNYADGSWLCCLRLHLGQGFELPMLVLRWLITK